LSDSSDLSDLSKRAHPQGAPGGDAVKRTLTAVVVLALIAGGAFVLRPRGTPVEMAQVVRRTVREYVIEDAKTRLPTSYVVDMPVNGTVERITHEAGDEVQEGEILARIDPFDIEQGIRGVKAMIVQAKAQIEGVGNMRPKAEDLDAARVRVNGMADNEAIARKQLTIARINYDNAKKEYGRLTNLLEGGITSQSAYDAAKRTYESLAQDVDRLKLAVEAAAKVRETADLERQSLLDSVDDNDYLREVYQAEIESLDARLAALNNDLAKTTVKAPVHGVILEKLVEGDRVLPIGTPLLLLGKLADVEIESDVLSEEVGPIRVGNAVEITGKALQNQTVMGQVTRIYPSGFRKISALGIEQQRVKVIIGFDNSERQLRPGTSLDVHVITAERPDALAVPERATFRRSDQWSVFAVRDGNAVLTPVTIGIKNDEWAEILDGLEEGDTIVAEPRNDLEDGMRVTAVE